MSVPIAQWAFRRLGKFSGRRSRAIPAVRVYVDPVEHPAAEKFVDRDAERLALDVPQRLLDPADGGEHDRSAPLAQNEWSYISDQISSIRNGSRPMSMRSLKSLTMPAVAVPPSP